MSATQLSDTLPEEEHDRHGEPVPEPEPLPTSEQTESDGPASLSGTGGTEPSTEAIHASRAPGFRRLAWRQRALWLGAAAFAVGGAGQVLLAPQAQRPLGTVLLVVAAAAAALAWSGRHDNPLLDAETPTPSAQASRRTGFHISHSWLWALRIAGIAGSVVLATLSIVADIGDPSAIFGLQGVLWLASMALLLLACARWHPRGEQAVRVGPRWTLGEIIVFVGLVALALFTHTAFLQEIPWRFHFDEGFAYTELMRFYRGPAISMFTTTWVNTTLPSLWFALAAQLMHFTGPTLLGVRLGVALAGAATVVPVYLLARLTWGRLAACLAGFGVSVSAAYVHYSRVSIINVTTPLAWAACFYFLVKGLRSRRPMDFAWSGLAAGLSMYTYYGTRLLPYLLAAYFLYLLVFHFRATVQRLGHFAILGVGLLAGYGPLFGYFIVNPASWVSRAPGRLTVPAAFPTSWEALAKDWNILAPLAGQNFLGFSVVPGRDTVWFAPLLLPAEAMLMVLGIGVLIWRWKQPASFLVLIWGASTVLTGGILLDRDSAPNFAHWTPSFPAFYLALALPLALMVGSVWRSRFWILDFGFWRAPRSRIRTSKLLGAGLLALLLAWDLWANAYMYLVQYPPMVWPDHSLEAIQGRFLEHLGSDTQMSVVGDTWQPLKPDIAQLMAPNTQAGNMKNPSRELPVPPVRDHGLAFLFYNDHFLYVPLLENFYPGGKVEDLRTPDGTLAAQSYEVPASAAWSRYGARARFDWSSEGGAQQTWEGQVPGVGYLPANSAFRYPLTAAWSGSLYVSRPGSIRLYAEGVTGAEISVLGQRLQPDGTIAVDSGWVPYQVRAQLDNYVPFQLYLQEEGGQAAPVDTGRLWPSLPGQGLAVTLTGAPTTHRVDLFVGSGRLLNSKDLNDPQALSLGSPGFVGQARWEGEVLTGDGVYQMTLRTDARARISIDGQTITGICPGPGQSGNQTNSAGVQLTAGWHKVRIDYNRTGGNDGLEWFWTRPDGVQEVVPPSALRVGPVARNADPIQWPDPPPPIVCGK